MSHDDDEKEVRPKAVCLAAAIVYVENALAYLEKDHAVAAFARLALKTADEQLEEYLMYLPSEDLRDVEEFANKLRATGKLD